MRRIREALARIAGAFTRRHADDELREEMEAHLEIEIAEYVRRGMSADCPTTNRTHGPGHAAIAR